MTQLDPERDQRRLAERYASMDDEELREIAKDARSLTDEAKAALRSEFSRRGLAIALEDTSPVQPPGGPVVLRRYLWLADALLAQSILNSASIESVLVDEHTIRMDWFWSLALGEVKLWVRAEDAADASNLLDQDRIESFVVPGLGEYVQAKCPNCGSLEVSYRQLIKRLAYASLALFWVLSFVPPTAFREPAWRCQTCGHAWDDRSEANVQALGES